MTHEGNLWPQDRWGRVLNAALDREELPSQLMEACEDALTLCLDRFSDDLHSFYVTGPAARGRVGVVRFVAILRGTALNLSTEAFCVAARNTIRQQNPGLGPCSLTVFNWRDVFPTDGRFSFPRFKLGVTSLCIAGRDLNRLIAPLMLTAGAANPPILDFERRMNSLSQRLKAVSSDARIRATSKGAALQFLSTAFALIMLDENVYTEDPDMQARLFRLYHPDQAHLADWAERFIREPNASALEGLAFIEGVSRFLPDLCNRWLDEHNPNRERALKLV